MFRSAMTVKPTSSVDGIVCGAARSWAALFLQVGLDVLDYVRAPDRLVLVADQAGEHLSTPASLLIELLGL